MQRAVPSRPQAESLPGVHLELGLLDVDFGEAAQAADSITAAKQASNSSTLDPNWIIWDLTKPSVTLLLEDQMPSLVIPADQERNYVPRWVVLFCDWQFHPEVEEFCLDPSSNQKTTC